MKIRNTKIIWRSLFIITVITVIGVVSVSQLSEPETLRAESLSELREKSKRLQDEIEKTDKKTEQLSKKSRSLKNTISELDNQIVQAEAKIERTQVKVDILSIELDKAQKELDRQKDLLRSSMRALYKRGDASTVELIVGSDSFSEFMNEQEYLERLKLGVQDSAETVLELKLDIQSKKEKQEELLDQQEANRHRLASSKNEKANLLAQTRGQEAAYREHLQQLTNQQDEIFQEILARSSNVIIGGGSYPWHHAKCAHPNVSNCLYEWHIDGEFRDPWGYFYRNCTSYVAWKFNKGGYPVPGLGHGGQWYANAPDYAKSTIPKKGAAVSFSGGAFGHVAFVEQVLSGGRIVISEYNFAKPGEYSQRTILTSQEPINGYIYPWKL